MEIQFTCHEEDYSTCATSYFGGDVIRIWLNTFLTESLHFKTRAWSLKDVGFTTQGGPKERPYWLYYGKCRNFIYWCMHYCQNTPLKVPSGIFL